MTQEPPETSLEKLRADLEAELGAGRELPCPHCSKPVRLAPFSERAISAATRKIVDARMVRIWIAKVKDPGCSEAFYVHVHVMDGVISLGVDKDKKSDVAGGLPPPPVEEVAGQGGTQPHTRPTIAPGGAAPPPTTTATGGVAPLDELAVGTSPTMPALEAVRPNDEALLDFLAGGVPRGTPAASTPAQPIQRFSPPRIPDLQPPAPFPLATAVASAPPATPTPPAPRPVAASGYAQEAARNRARDPGHTRPLKQIAAPPAPPTSTTTEPVAGIDFLMPRIQAPLDKRLTEPPDPARLAVTPPPMPVAAPRPQAEGVSGEINTRGPSAKHPPIRTNVATSLVQHVHSGISEAKAFARRHPSGIAGVSAAVAAAVAALFIVTAKNNGKTDLLKAPVSAVSTQNGFEGTKPEIVLQPRTVNCTFPPPNFKPDCTPSWPGQQIKFKPGTETAGGDIEGQIVEITTSVQGAAVQTCRFEVPRFNRKTGRPNRTPYECKY